MPHRVPRCALFVAALVAAGGAITPLRAQGSTGGTIGQRQKSASGGNAAEEQSHPSPTHEHAKGARRAARNISGRWSWQADCPTGDFAGAFRIVESADGQISGEFLSDSGGINTGHISGSMANDKISMNRERGNALAQDWDAVLTVSGKMQGTITSLHIPGCTFTASR